MALDTLNPHADTARVRGSDQGRAVADDEPDAGVPGEQFVTVLFLAGGAALVVFIVLGLSLLAGLVAAWAAAATGVWWVWTHGSLVARRRLGESVDVGLASGVLALVAYDASRLAAVQLLGLHTKPFEAFRSFGDALLPGRSRTGAALVVGTAYHVLNGLTFSIAYTGLFGRRGVPTGVLYGLALELAMITLYPGWLNIKTIDEFAQMSIVGHLCFGAVLGLSAKTLLARRDLREVQA